MNDSYAPVVVFAYRRFRHLSNTLSALNESLVSKETDLFIFCDHWKNDVDKEAVLKTWEIVDDFCKCNNFKKVFVRKSQDNLGLAKSVITGVSEIMELYGRAIVVEDDLVTSRHFLCYMNEALDYYRGFKNVWSISGYSFYMSAFKSYQHDVYFTGRCCSWGWATWKDRWDRTDWEMSDYDSFINDRKAVKDFSKWGDDMPCLLKLQKENRIDSWAIRWCYSAFKNNALSVYPVKSFVDNRGFDGSGTHSSSKTNGFEAFYDGDDDIKALTFEKPFIDKKINKQFSLKYSRKLINRIIRKIQGIFTKKK